MCNRLRVIADRQKVYIREILTHTEYVQANWKEADT